MFKRLKNCKGIFNIVALEIVLLSVAALLAGTALTVPQIKDPFRARKATDLCYCMEEGGSEYGCKARTEIEVKEGISLETCKATVASMSKEEILTYIKDDVVFAEVVVVQ